MDVAVSTSDLHACRMDNAVEDLLIKDTSAEMSPVAC